MDIKIKELSYGTLLSHTFPGFLLGIQMLYALYLIFPTIFQGILPQIDLQKLEAKNIIYYSILTTACVVAIFIMSALLGSILDAIHNYLFDDCIKESIEIEKDIIKKITQVDLEIYNSFMTDDSWYMFETLSNTGIALIPSILFLIYWFYSSIKIINILHSVIFCFLGIFYFLIEYIMFKEAKEVLKEDDEIMKAFLERFEMREKKEKANIG